MKVNILLIYISYHKSIIDFAIELIQVIGNLMIVLGLETSCDETGLALYDKPIISKKENEHNSPIFLWFFEDRIVYMKDFSRGEF